MFRRSSGLGEQAFSLAIICLAAYGAYCLYTEYRSPYTLVKRSSGHYLVEKGTGRREIITPEFQLGSLEHRIKGLLSESKEHVQAAIESSLRSYRQ